MKLSIGTELSNGGGEMNMDTQDTMPTKTENVFHDMSTSTPLFSSKVIILFILVILLGIGSGYVLAKHAGTVLPGSTSGTASSGSVAQGVTYGSGDSTTFKDTAEGVVQKGGIGTEGQYHLVRPGGASQYVYMTSSLVDLSQFIGHSVKVWGATQKAQQAGWLMDVGKVEVEH